MTLRRAVFWVHLAVGVTAASIVFMMSVTGVMLTYEAQLNRWALAGYRTTHHSVGRSPLDTDQLVGRVGAASSQAVTSLTIGADPRDPLRVRFDDGRIVYVDRYTGQVLGDGDTRTRRFLRGVLAWHRWLALDGEARLVGRTLTAVSNLGFLFLILSGLFLWWPRRQTRTTLRQAVWFRPNLTGRARDFNWHSVIGLWAAVPLLVIVASGATISYRWAGDLAYRVVGETPPAPVSRTEPEPAVGETVASLGFGAGDVALHALVTNAAAAAPGWRTITLRLPESGAGLVTLTVDRGSGRQPAKTEELTVDSSSGEVVERGGYPTFSRGLKLRRWLRYAHTGEVYGLLGQSVAGAASLGTAVLVWTGLAMSWRRFFT